MSAPPTSTSKTAPTGITGPDGSCRAELLSEQGYTVHRPKRRASSCNTSRSDHRYQEPQQRGLDGGAHRFQVHYGDLGDQSHVAVSDGIATGRQESVRRFRERAAAVLGGQHTLWMEALVAEMVAHDRQEAAREATLHVDGLAVAGSLE